MRKNCERHEPRSGPLVGKSETEESMTTWMDAFDQGYEEGFEAGVEEAKEQFMQTQLLIFHTGGNA